jgi:hypothetical protein
MEFKSFYTDKYAEISVKESEKIILITCKVSFIPESDFKNVFAKAGDLSKKYFINKMIFDKRSLTVFHQPSMEWYHLVWKKEMLPYGLKTYRKILPDDTLFKKSVEIGKAKILKEHPDNILSKLDIRYCDNLEEAML